MKEALVIETGELLDIKFHYKTISGMMKFECELPPELTKTIKTENTITESWIKTNSEGGMSPTSPPEENKKEKLPYYVLSDGNKYLEKELIVGLDNIREYRIKNIIE
jgi:hypothetical protein